MSVAPTLCVLDSLCECDLSCEFCCRVYHLTLPRTATRIASGVLEHFIQAYRSAPESTSGTFLLPEWTDYPFWKLVKGAHLVARYPKGTPLFTSPDWDKLRLPGGGHSLGSERSFRGNTRWPVVVINFPCSGARRACESRLSASGGSHQDRGGCGDVHVLRGDPHRDGPLMRGMPPGIVR